jgi:hypothetical protein
MKSPALLLASAFVVTLLAPQSHAQTQTSPPANASTPTVQAQGTATIATPKASSSKAKGKSTTIGKSGKAIPPPPPISRVRIRRKSSGTAKGGSGPDRIDMSGKPVGFYPSPRNINTPKSQESSTKVGKRAAGPSIPK